MLQCKFVNFEMNFDGLKSFFVCEYLDYFLFNFLIKNIFCQKLKDFSFNIFGIISSNMLFIFVLLNIIRLKVKIIMDNILKGEFLDRMGLKLFYVFQGKISIFELFYILNLNIDI